MNAQARLDYLKEYRNKTQQRKGPTEDQPVLNESYYIMLSASEAEQCGLKYRETHLSIEELPDYYNPRLPVKRYSKLECQALEFMMKKEGRL